MHYESLCQLVPPNQGQCKAHHCNTILDATPNQNEFGSRHNDMVLIEGHIYPRISSCQYHSHHLPGLCLRSEWQSKSKLHRPKTSYCLFVVLAHWAHSSKNIFAFFVFLSMNQHLLIVLENAPHSSAVGQTALSGWKSA